MRTKSFFTKLVNLLCICAILFIYQGFAEKRQDKITAMEEKANAERLEAARNSQQKESLYIDGTYTGSAQGFGGIVEVELVIKGGVIASARATSADKETPDYFKQAEKIFEKVVNEQSVDVDVVTGATYSSNGIINGLKEALEKAGNK